MATCRWCGRSGIFLSVSSNGMCGSCEPAVVDSVLTSTRVIEESLGLVKNSKKLETRLSRCDTVIQHAQHLRQYEDRGIPTIDPPPSQLVIDMPKEKDEIVVTTLNNELSELLVTLDPQPSTTVRTNRLLKLLARVRSFLPQMKSRSDLEQLEQRVLDRIHSAQLQGYLEAAKKAEFKGKTKKAIDHYFDALYFLMNDDIDDTHQHEVLTEIRGKLHALGAENVPK